MQKTTRRRFGAGAVALAVAATLAACSPTAEADETSIRIAVTSLVPQYNPELGAYMYSSLNINAVYDSLLLSTADGGYEPWLATAFELSDDRRTLSFTLREDVTFTDGTRLDAENVVQYFTGLLASETFPFLDLMNVQFETKFAVTGEFSFEVTASKPINDYLIYTIAVTTPIASAAASEDPEALSEAPVGTGPYVIDEAESDIAVSFVRNPDYWNPDAYPFDRVELRAFADDVAALNALKSGQIDAAQLSIPNGVEAESQGFNVSSATGRMVLIWFADRAGSIQPALADVRVRQAIAYAIDRASINDVLNLGYGSTISQPFSPALPEYVEGGDDRYEYDLDMARSLMEDAGYADGFDISIPMTGFLGLNTYAPAIQQALSEINIRVTFEETGDVGEFFELARGGTYPALVYSEAFVNIPSGFLYRDGFWNYLGYVDPTAQAFVDTIQNGTIEESAEASRELGEYVLEEAWLVPVATPYILWASVTGTEVDVASGNSGAPYLINFRLDD